MMTNLEIIMLIEIHCFVYQDQMVNQNGSTAAVAGIKKLMRQDLITVDPRSPPPDADDRPYSPFCTTERGAAHLKNLQELGLPVKETRWVLS